MSERLNVRSAAVVLGALLVASLSVALVHGWQVRRHAAGLLELAERAEANGRAERVLWLLAEYLQLVPNDTAARAKYGTAREQLARDKKARAAVAGVYEQVLAEAPDRADIRLRLAHLYATDNQYDLADQHLKALGADATTDPEVAALWGACREAKRDAKGAEKAYRAAIKYGPNRVDRYFRLAFLLRRTGGSDDAWVRLTDQALDALRTRNLPDDLLAKLNPLKGRALPKADFKNEVDKLLSADEKDKFRSLILNQVSEEAAKAAAVAADDCIKDMVAHNPAEPVAFLRQAQYRLEFKAATPAPKFETTIAQDLETAVKSAPTSADVRFTAAAAAATPEAARDHLRIGLEHHPRDERLYLALATAERASGNRAGAWFQLTDRALDALRTRNLPDDLLAKLNPLKGRELPQADFESEVDKLLSADEKDKFRGLILNQARVGPAEVLRRGVARLPGNPRLLFAQAELALETGDLPETRRVLDEIDRWKLAPERSLLLLARWRMAEGNWAEARTILEAGRPTLATARERAAEVDVLLGNCLEHLGMDDLALGAYRRAEDGDPTNAAAQTGIARTLLAQGRLGEAVDKFQGLTAIPTAGAEVRLLYTRLRVLEYLSTPRPSRDPKKLEPIFEAVAAKVPNATELLLFLKYLSTPRPRRDPKKLEPIFEAVAAKVPNATELLLLRIEVLADQEPDEAEGLLRKALKDRPGATDIGLPLVRLLARQGRTKDARDVLGALDVNGGASVDVALARLDLVPSVEEPRRPGAAPEAALGIVPLLAKSMLNCPGVAARVDSVQKIEQLLARTDRVEDRLRLFGGLVDANIRWQNLAEARRWCLEIARLRPAEVSVRVRLLNLAIQADDRGQMEQAVREIERAEGTGGPFGQYAEAVLRIARPEDQSPTGFREARQYLRDAARARPAWAELVSTSGLLYELEGNPDAALTDYLRAVLDLGERRQIVIRRAVQLLCARRRYAEAERVLQKLRPEGERTDLNKMAAVVFLYNKQPERAIELAAGVVAARPEQYEEHLWQAEILAATGRKKEALEALRRAVHLAGTHAAPWVELVRFHVRNGQKEEAKDALDEMVGWWKLTDQSLNALRTRNLPEPVLSKLKPLEDKKLRSIDFESEVTKLLSADEKDKFLKLIVNQAEMGRLAGPELPLARAQCHEALGNSAEAAKWYQAAAEAQPDELDALRPLVEFHDRTGTPGAAVPALRRAFAAESPLKTEAWVRRALAGALSRTGDYGSFQEAERLVDQALAAAPDDPDELLTKARVLATRLDRRREALSILLRVQKQHPFGPAEEFFLGQLYADTGAWPEGRRILVNLVAREAENPTYLRFLVDRLLQNGEAGEAAAWLARLDRLAPGDPSTIRLHALTLVKRGRIDDAKSYLQRAARPDPGPNEAERTRTRARAVARIADELGREHWLDERKREHGAEELFPVAEALYREAAKDGIAGDELALAGFLGRRGKIDEAVKLARGAEGRAGAAAVVGTLVSAAYSTTPLSDNQLDALEAEAKACLGRAKPSPALAGLTGLLDARRGRYADAARAFRTVVDGPKPDPEALNNLAYMLILTKAPEDEVDKLLEEALARVGPTASLRDTRGRMHLAYGHIDKAIADFEQAVEQTPSAAKCLHLAAAYQRAGRTKDAAALLARADALRSDGSLVLPAERQLRDELISELQKKSN